jgi:cytochrome P450
MGLQEGVRACTPAGRHGGGSSAIGASDVIGSAPWSDHDPYTDEALLDPWPGYQHLRDAGPAVWLPKYEMFALTRYASVRRALEDWESFRRATA